VNVFAEGDGDSVNGLEVFDLVALFLFAVNDLNLHSQPGGGPQLIRGHVPEVSDRD
jgi:hypothetical protein